MPARPATHTPMALKIVNIYWPLFYASGLFYVHFSPVIDDLHFARSKTEVFNGNITLLKEN